MATPYLFVYGTLRPGAGGAPARRLAREANRLGSGETRGQLLLVDRYPGLVAGDGRVTGEAHELRAPEDALNWLDRYEGPEFRREVGTVRLKDGGMLDAWMYRYIGSCAGLRTIAGGDFLREG